MFSIGQRVVCIQEVDWANHKHHKQFLHHWPKKGQVLTIAAVETCTNVVGLAFEEIVNPLILSRDKGRGDAHFDSVHFRPVIERKTDISIFTKMLDKLSGKLRSHQW